MLRDRANKRLGADTNAESKDDHAQSLVTSEPNKHINFWEELEASGGTSGENPEAQADKKAADDKWERQITMYLDKAAKEPAPWYASNRRLSGDKEDEESKKVPDDPKQKAKFFKKRKREMRDIEREDPLSIVRTSLGSKKSSNAVIKSGNDRSREDDRHKNKDKKPKHTHSKHSNTSSSSKSIEQLRAERVARERAERQRTNALLRGTSEVVDSDRNRHRYNSQFNPTDTEKAHQRYRRG
ncbi:hypothetical protein NQZ79_g4072 [Umbelopsis isabellina]|nr:hypothetical protein NQZ79_g4072 [Umbelopsis isabellina]